MCFSYTVQFFLAVQPVAETAIDNGQIQKTMDKYKRHSRTICKDGGNIATQLKTIIGWMDWTGYYLES